MKLWIKYALGAGIGVMLGTFIPLEGYIGALHFGADIVERIGRYTVFPLVFFSLAYGTFRLRIDQRFYQVYAKGIALIAASSLLLVALGTGAVLLFSPDPVPIVTGRQAAYEFPSLYEAVAEVLPHNMFQVFFGDGTFLLPVVAAALFVGLNLGFDKGLTKPVVHLFDSLSRIVYNMAYYIIEVMGFGLIILSAFWMTRISTTPEIEFFSQLFILLGVITSFVLLVVYPVILYFYLGKQNPYKWMYALTAPAIAAFFSGNSYFAYLPLMRHGRENLGVQRRVGAALFPLFTLFGKGGTAMVTAVSFIIVVNAYTSLALSFSSVLWVMGLSLAAALVTGSVPGIGTLVALAFLCSRYAGGLEEGYLLLVPAAPVLVGFSVLLDTVTAGIGSFMISIKEKGHREIYVKDFI